MTIYTVAMGKGGVAKSTTAAELMYALAMTGRRTLGIDLDQQGNLTTRMGLTRAAHVAAVAADVLSGESTAEEAAVDAPSLPGEAQIIAGTQGLAGLEHRPELSGSLLHYLPTLTAWDDIVIDTPPALGVITVAALAAADVVIAPVACEAEAYEQLDRLNRLVTQNVTRMRPGQTIRWVMPTRHDGRRILDREVIELLHERYPGRVTRPIREAVAARDSYVAGQTISVFAPRSKVAQDYAAALAQIISANGQPHPANQTTTGQGARS